MSLGVDIGKWTKVFWFFFSKKELLAFLPLALAASSARVLPPQFCPERVANRVRNKRPEDFVP
jgi:hypothetical protein